MAHPVPVCLYMCLCVCHFCIASSLQPGFQDQVMQDSQSFLRISSPPLHLTLPKNINAAIILLVASKLMPFVRGRVPLRADVYSSPLHKIPPGLHGQWVGRGWGVGVESLCIMWQLTTSPSRSLKLLPVV